MRRDVAHPLEVGRHAHRGHDHPQVGRHRLLAGEQVDGGLVEVLAQGVELDVGGDDRLGQGHVGVEQGCGGAADGRTGQPGHLDEFLGDSVEFLVEGLAHVDPSCLGVLADALSQSDVNAQGTSGEHLTGWSKSHA